MSEAKHMDKHISKKVQKWIQSQDANVIQSQCQLCQGSSFRLSFILVTSTSLALGHPNSRLVSRSAICTCQTYGMRLAILRWPSHWKNSTDWHWYLIDGGRRLTNRGSRSGNKNKFHWNFKNMPVLDTLSERIKFCEAELITGSSEPRNMLPMQLP